MKTLGKKLKERLFPRQSILSKLLFVIMATVILSLVFTGIVLSINSWADYRKIGAHSIATLASLVGENSTAALAFGDRRVATELLSSLRSNPEIRLACLYSNESDVFATYTRKGHAENCPREVPAPGHYFEANMLGYSGRVTHESEDLGYIYLLSDMRNFRDRLRFNILLLVGVTVSGGFLALFVASRLRHLVSDPVLKLAETASFIAEKGKYTLRAEESTELEINTLVRAFNRMLDLIETREAALRQSEEQFRATFDVAAVGKVLVSPTGRFLRVNSEFCKMLGYTTAELLDRYFDDLTHPDDKKDSMREFQKLVSGETQITVLEKRYLTRGGEILWAIVSAAPIRDSTGRVAAIVTVIQNITERKRAEQERDRLLLLEREARVEAEKSVQARDDFLSIASHELKTPITPIKIHMQLIQRHLRQLIPEASPQQQALLKAFATSDRQIDTLERLIDDLLDVSRITAGRLLLDREPVDLAELIRDVLERMHPETSRAGCEVTLTAEPGTIGSWDRSRVEQIVINLLTNAIKYGAGKPVEITVAKTDGAARLVVRDHGIGIAKENQRRIFERFERVAPVKHYSGLGLGLYIIREIIAAHGGSIRVESEPGQGATFAVELPLGRVHAAPTLQPG